MQNKYLFSTFLCLILGTTIAQELRLTHLFLNERARRIRMPNGEERFLSISNGLPELNIYTGNYTKIRSH